MRILTVLGTRPEIIRLSRVIPLLDEHSDHVLVHTGQNYTEKLSDVFFNELAVREPDIHLGVQEPSFGAQIGEILRAAEAVFLDYEPDRVLLLGDTNSALTAVIAKRMGIPVYHMEAGNRCFDDRVPEEVNRRIIDHSSTVLLPYTERAKANLVREGFEEHRVYVTGNPIGQVLAHNSSRIEGSDVLSRLGLADRGYLLVTAHRAENVDDPERLHSFYEAWVTLAEERGIPVVVSMHPRTRSKASAMGLDFGIGSVLFLEPLGFFDFVRLERGAACILTDSGTVQEEACILRVPSVTTRDTTERPETVDAGSNLLVGTSRQAILNGVELAMALPTDWAVPQEYLVDNVAESVVRLVLSHRLRG